MEPAVADNDDAEAWWERGKVRQKRGNNCRVPCHCESYCLPRVLSAARVAEPGHIPLQWWQEARSAWTHIVIGPGAGAGGRNQDAENAN
ncbi:hypothetical protein PENSPDRAFT_648742 [Peniophora sp. CONT]|nr:hypothetical protein PENSPDRAFT_648742 [Peniophora sp. CONT]